MDLLRYLKMLLFIQRPLHQHQWSAACEGTSRREPNTSSDRKCRPSAARHTQRSPGLSSNHSFIVIIIYIPLVLLSCIVWLVAQTRLRCYQTLADVHYSARLSQQEVESIKKPINALFYSDCRGSRSSLACFIWILINRSRFFLVLVDAIFSTHLLHCPTPIVSFLIYDDLCMNDVQL